MSIQTFAWLSLAINALGMLVAPSAVGKPREPLSGGAVSLAMITAIPSVVVCLHVLGFI